MTIGRGLVALGSTRFGGVGSIYAGCITRPPTRHLPFLDVAPSPFRWRLGLRPLDPGEWLQVGPDHDDELAEKAAVMASHPATAFAVIDEARAASEELADLVVGHLRDVHDREVDLAPGLHPLDAAGRVVAEDLVLMVERDGRLICGGGSVCFPNRWDLRSKVGRSMREIHEPVALLNRSLADPIDRFLDRLVPERSYWRLGWGVLDTDEHYQPVDGTAPAIPDDVPVDRWVVRVERETLRRLPATGAVVFTIRTQITPLRQITDASTLRHLADAVDAMPEEVAAYKQLESIRADLGRWLRQSATTSVQ